MLTVTNNTKIAAPARFGWPVAPSTPPTAKPPTIQTKISDTT
jgi:hypothetical protein